MKKVLTLVALLFAAFVFQSCEGPQGPMGPQGMQGPQGPKGDSGDGSGALLSATFQFTGNLNAGNDYTIGKAFPNTIEVFESDAVLVYRHSGSVNIDGISGAVDLWQPLPQIRMFGDKLMQYNFDHTFVDVEIFLDGNVDFAALDNAYTQNQTFRVVIIPADFINGRRGSIDFNNYNEVAKALQIEERNVIHL